MTQRYCAAIRIDAFQVQADLPDHRKRLHSKGLIQLNKTDVIQSQARKREGLGNCDCRSDTHNLWRHSCSGEAHKARDRLQAKLSRFRFRHDKRSSSAIGYLGRVPGCYCALRMEDRFQLCQRLHGCIAARTFVFNAALKRYDFILESSCGLSVESVRMATERKLVLLLPCYAVLALEALGR